MRCPACGVREGESHCEDCHRAAELSTWGPRRAPVPPPPPQVHGPIMEDFDGAELRRRRLAAGLTQAELGRRCDISGSDISAYETGKKPPRWDRWSRLDAALAEVLVSR